jgi:hypothetical protein
MRRPGRSRLVGTAVVFSVLTAVWLYLVFDAETDAIGDPSSLVLAPLLFGAGLVAGRWEALLLALVPALLAIPLGTPQPRDIPLVVTMLMLVGPLGVVLIAAGVLASRLIGASASQDR